MIRALTIASLLGLLAVQIASAAVPQATLTGIEERASRYDKLFYPAGVPSQYLDPKITPGVAKIRELRTVIPGVLYRAGGPGGTKPLPDEALQALCEAGFSLAIYGYTDNWTPHSPVSCTSRVTGSRNTLEYVSLEASDSAAKKTALTKISRVILDPSAGPALVHCWNGYHASGELAAVALRQFCDKEWNGDSASAYWLRHANGAAMISRIKKFQAYPDLIMPAEVQAELCKQTR